MVVYLNLQGNQSDHRCAKGQRRRQVRAQVEKGKPIGYTRGTDHTHHLTNKHGNSQRSFKKIISCYRTCSHTRLTQTLMSERRCGRKEMIGCRCRVRQIPSIRLLAASHSTCLLVNTAPTKAPMSEM